MQIHQVDMVAVTKACEEHTRLILTKEFKRPPTDDEFFAALACMKHGIALGAETIKQALGLK